MSKNQNLSKTKKILISIIALCSSLSICIIFLVASGIGKLILFPLQSTFIVGSAMNEFTSQKFDIKLTNVEVIDNTYILTVQVKNISSLSETFMTGFNLYLYDDIGINFKEDSNYAISNEQSLNRDIKPGETFTGKIAYKLTRTPTSLTLGTRDSFYNSINNTIKVK